MVSESEPTPCAKCEHYPHTGRCGHPITEDIYVGNGMFDPVGTFYRSMIVDDCHCGADGV